MESPNISIDEFCDGEDAYEYCFTRTPDMIVLNQQSSDELSGLAFIRLYRDTVGQHRSLPTVVFCITENQENLIEEAKNLGIRECIKIPYVTATVKRKLQKIIAEMSSL